MAIDDRLNLLRMHLEAAHVDARIAAAGEVVPPVAKTHCAVTLTDPGSETVHVNSWMAWCRPARTIVCLPSVSSVSDADTESWLMM